MARLFPLRSETPTGDNQPRVVDLQDEDADAVFGALSSTTAREIYAALNEQPRTPSDVADAIDSSIQNVRYHLEKLESAGLIEVVDTWYSSRGNEMSVYATANGPLIVTGDRSTADRLKAALSRYLGGIVALAGASLFVQYGLERFFGPGAEDRADGGSDGTADDDAAADSENDAGADSENGAADGSENGADDGDPVDGAVDDSADDADSESAGDTDFDSAGEDELSDDTETGLEDADSEPVGNETDDDGTVGNGTNATEDGAGDDATSIDTRGGDDAAYVDPAADGTNVTDGGAEVAEAVFAAIPPGMLFFLGGLLVLTAMTVYWYWRTY